MSSASNEPVSVISFFLEPFPSTMPSREVAARFRKFATAPNLQGQGIGSRLLAFASADVSRIWPEVRKLWCDARVSSMEWYIRRRMYPIEGEARFFKGDVEYLRMGLNLDDTLSAS